METRDEYGYWNHFEIFLTLSDEEFQRIHSTRPPYDVIIRLNALSGRNKRIHDSQ